MPILIIKTVSTNFVTIKFCVILKNFGHDCSQVQSDEVMNYRCCVLDMQVCVVSKKLFTVLTGGLLSLQTLNSDF